MRIQHEDHRLGENFPVASWLLPSHCRENILIFYDFVRGLDNIADDPDTTPQERYNTLVSIQKAFSKQQVSSLPPWAQHYAHYCGKGEIHPSYGNTLMSAFLLDTQKTRYASWKELLDYCALSAAPVGRFVLDQCHESMANLRASDVLCNVLQILNHLQDMKQDYQNLDRIYLPLDMMQQHGVKEADLGADRMSAGLRQLSDKILLRCTKMLDEAGILMSSIRCHRVRLEVAWIHQLALRLLALLQQHDPLQQPIRLPKARMLMALWPALRKI